MALQKKEMAFNLTDKNGVSLKNAPKSDKACMSKGEKKRRRDAAKIAAYEALPPLQRAANDLLTSFTATGVLWAIKCVRKCISV